MSRSSSTRNGKKDSSSRGSGQNRSRSNKGKDSKSQKGRTRPDKKRAGEEQSVLFAEPAQIMGPRLLFILSVVALCIFGLIMVYSASSISAYKDFGDTTYYFVRQSVFLGLSVIVCVIFAAIPYKFWGNRVVFLALWIVSVLLLTATAFGLGVSALGAERSIIIAGFALQPAEFAKIFVLLTIASLAQIYMDGEMDLRKFAVMVAVAAIVPIILIYHQPDLGTAIILAVGIITLAALAGISWKIIIGIFALLGAYVVFSCVTQPYHLQRIITMFNPWIDPQGDGYQSIQSLYAFGSGGIFGTGLGLSRQKYLYLPYAHTDFIFAVVGEELGIFGAFFVVALFGVFIFAGMRICRSAPDMFGCMIAGSMTTMIGFQACVNMACVTGIAPVTGKALPFLSYGGSSLLATMMMVGIILSVSFRSRVGARYERKRDSFVVYEGGSGDYVEEEENASNVISLRVARRKRERRENLERTSHYSRKRNDDHARKRERESGRDYERNRDRGRERSRARENDRSARDTRLTRQSSTSYSRNSSRKTGGYSDLKPKRK